ncbi:unnamed protein product [Brassica oleracea var. botrytis]
MKKKKYFSQSYISFSKRTVIIVVKTMLLWRQFSTNPAAAQENPS